MDFQWEQGFTDIQQSEIEILQAYQVTHEFYQEVQYREDFEQYCQWYAETAERHQQELQKMRGDINLFSWFLRGRGTN
ncbi:hypothetical protein [Lyngbya sp. PCC 8106]|uniref:hypothetical protein n=1 Tax=Lyngbya sp. (strain PCC 8106) TaxID=313612 RepID=UPI0000EAD178|nr:hypothetical protein [Lyngbya sp. PCC 8106]EAW38241.1 hypothetical protein L8106_09466 [Lyngbya sp. PCC 8106]